MLLVVWHAVCVSCRVQSVVCCFFGDCCVLLLRLLLFAVLVLDVRLVVC